ncbi:MAG: hypothetical protein PHV13_04695 [Candidatus ainarchaeum sp.]|nr:hypothetical protein [Candidatus ainarchaeum sp.]
MGQTFAEKEVEGKKALPKIARSQAELHGPLEALSRGASHIYIRPDGTYKSVQEAGKATRILSNIQALLPEGSAPLITRFARMLDTL